MFPGVQLIRSLLVITLRSLEKLDLDAAWRRTLYRARARVADVPDRLPFEVVDRFWSATGGPTLQRAHEVRPSLRVPATKAAQPTARPFVRLHPRDLMLYQALVDALIVNIEANLGSRDEIFGYRMSPPEKDDPFDGTPSWIDFRATLHQLAMNEFDGYVLECDVSSYFMNIDVAELGRRLLEAMCDGDVVRDLEALLEHWRHEGIRGLPQGVPPSSPLANFFLARADNIIRQANLPFVRFMDDIAVITPTYQSARRILDELEAHLYGEGLSLGGGKTKISRVENVLSRLTPEDEVEFFIESIRDAGEYAPDDAELQELQLEQVCAIFDRAHQALADDDYRRSEFTFAFQQLARHKSPHAVAALPGVLLRMPGLTAPACRYLETVASSSPAAVLATLEKITDARFHRSQEWLHLLRACQRLPSDTGIEIAPRLKDLAETHVHELVRARALLSWGRLSHADEFDLVDSFMEKEGRRWYSYAVVAVQGKETSGRNTRYDEWGKEGRSLAWLVDSVRGQPFAWSKI